MDKKTIVVVGAGQGLGNHVAKRFGKESFRVVLMRGKSFTNSRTARKRPFLAGYWAKAYELAKKYK